MRSIASVTWEEKYDVQLNATRVRSGRDIPRTIRLHRSAKARTVGVSCGCGPVAPCTMPIRALQTAATVLGSRPISPSNWSSNGRKYQPIICAAVQQSSALALG